MTGESTVVTFKADRAEEFVARFVAWAGADVPVQDLGTLDGRHRYRVPSGAWRRYTRQADGRRAT